MAMPAQWLRVDVVYSSPQRVPFVNILFYKPSATVTVDQTEADACATAADAAVHGNFKGIITTASTYLGVNVSLHDGNLVFDSSAAIHAGSGTISGDEEPDYVAAVVQKRTNTGGRSGRGRWFFGCVPEGLTDENSLTNAGISDYDALAAVLNGPLTVGSNTYDAQMHSTKLNTLLPLVSWRVDKYLGRQSRRRVRPAI